MGIDGLPSVWAIPPGYGMEFNTIHRAQDISDYFFNRILHAFEITGGTGNITNWRMLQILQARGFGAIAPHAGKLWFLPEGLPGGKFTPEYLPELYIGANPYIGETGWSYELKVDADCVLIRNDHRSKGFGHIIWHNAALMAENEKSMIIASINSRMMDILQASNDSDAAAAQKYLDDIKAGKLAVVTSKYFFDGLKVNPGASQSGIITDLIELEQYLKASTFNDLGLSANYNMKREAINSGEAQLGFDSLLPLMQDSLVSIREGLDRVNEMYGEYLENGPYSIEFSSSWAVREEEQGAQLDAFEDPDSAAGQDSGTSSDPEEKEDKPE